MGKDFEKQENLDHPEMASYRQFLQEFASHPRVHRLGFLPNEDLVAVMNLADVLLLPSFYEGFGLTILEAQACGTSVVTANISSVPEVAGDGAILVNPHSVNEISKAIRMIIESEDQRTKLVKAGFKNVSCFSWENTAKDTIKVYENIISRGS